MERLRGILLLLIVVVDLYLSFFFAMRGDVFALALTNVVCASAAVVVSKR